MIVWAVLLGCALSKENVVDYNSDWGLQSPLCKKGL